LPRVARLDLWAAMHRVGKSAAGRELDGRTWDEYPAVAGA
jgi:protein gp37